MKRIVIGLFLIFILISMISLSSAESSIAEQPGFGSKIILKAKQILHLNNDLMRDIYKANEFYFFNGYGPNVDSAKTKYQYQTYYNEYRICEKLEETLETNCTMKAEAKKASYDDLPLYENYAVVRAFKQPDKQVEYSETDNYKYGKFDQLTFWLNSGDNSYQYNTNNPGVLVVQEITNWSIILITDMDKALEEFVGTNPRLRKTTLDDREVLEIYNSESSSHPNIEKEYFVYFDAKDYKFIKEVEREKEVYDLLINGKEVSFINLKQRIQTFPSYATNLSDEEFSLWNGTNDTPNLRDMKRCYPAPTEQDKILKQINELETEMREKEGKEYYQLVTQQKVTEKITEEEWNEFTSLTSSWLKMACQNPEPVSYADYVTLKGYDWYWEGGVRSELWRYGFSRQEFLDAVNKINIERGSRLQE